MRLYAPTQRTYPHTQPNQPHHRGAGRELHTHVALAAVGATIPDPYHNPQATAGERGTRRYTMGEEGGRSGP